MNDNLSSTTPDDMAEAFASNLTGMSKKQAIETVQALLPLTGLLKQTVDEILAILPDPQILPELPTEPDSVILDATTDDGSHCKFMSLLPGGTWAGVSDDGWLRSRQRDEITSWTPGRVLAGPEPATLAEAVADWCERNGWWKYNPGRMTPNREQVHIYNDGTVYSYRYSSKAIAEGTVAWVKPDDTDKEEDR